MDLAFTAAFQLIWPCLFWIRPAEVLCVVKTHCARARRVLARVNDEVLLTPRHPVRLKGQWYESSNVGQLEVHDCPFVYNFVLSQSHIMVASGVECATLGHMIEEESVKHPYWGSQWVVEDLRKRLGWEAGFICQQEVCCTCREHGRTDGERHQLQTIRRLISGSPFLVCASLLLEATALRQTSALVLCS